jgi:hypothetical protein
VAWYWYLVSVATLLVTATLASGRL